MNYGPPHHTPDARRRMRRVACMICAVAFTMRPDGWMSQRDGLVEICGECVQTPGRLSGLQLATVTA